MWSVAMARGELDKAIKQAEHVLALAEEMGKPDLELEARHTLWGTVSMTGDLVASRHHAERGIELYRFEQHGDYGFVYGNHDPGICARYTNAAVLWLQGYSEQARVQVEDAMVLTRRHTQPAFFNHGLIHCCKVYVLLGDESRVREIAEQAQILAQETADPEESAYCEIVLGWTRAMQGEYADGITQMETALAARPPGSHQYDNCHYLSMLAEACYLDGQFERGIRHLRQALEEIKVSGELWWEAELHRLEGCALLGCDGENSDKAQDCFQRALDVTQSQDAKMLELRAASDLCRLLRDQGARQEALDLLAPVYEWFTEGFETADLRAAKALLEELS
jgi:predicted ATPase